MLNSQIPVGTLSDDSASTEAHLSFDTPGDLDRAWELGLFYLKTPGNLNLEFARQFGSGLIDTDSPYRGVPQYGELEGFIALENNQQTKLALRREHWDQHYPEHIAVLAASSTASAPLLSARYLVSPASPKRCGIAPRGGML